MHWMKLLRARFKRLPKYVYRCSECENTYDVIHAFGETIRHCSEADENSKCGNTSTMKRVPQTINFIKKQEKKAQVGQIVDDFIEDTKKEVEEYKEEMINWKPE
jgi:predicted nucleic acid-binding Zn ribbon protein